MGYKVDYEVLGDLGSQLAALRDEFDGVEDNIDGYKGAMGHDGVADKLGSFASNWSHKREEVAGNLDGVAQIASGAAGGYADADGQIADQLRGKGSSAAPAQPGGPT